MEGHELFDGDEGECELREGESGVEKDLSIFDTDLLLEVPVELEAKPEQRIIYNTVALAGISQNEEINKDAIFLDRIQKLLHEC